MAIPQVDIHRAITEGPRRVDQRMDGRRVLVAGHRQLAVAADIRHADADLIEPLVTQQAHGRPVGVVQVDVDAVVAAIVFEKMEALAQVLHQPLQMGCVRVPPPR